MTYPFNYPTPQNADVQIFIGQATTATVARRPLENWQKPIGASFVWFTLIGCGGNGAAASSTVSGGGGGSGAVTNCLMPAFMVPDSLNVLVCNPTGTTAFSTQILYRHSNSTFVLLEAANGSNGTIGLEGAGGASSTGTFFSCAGLFQSIAGQTGAVDTSGLSASTSTFLGGGVGTSLASANTANYGYGISSTTGVIGQGYFQFQPIIVGRGANNNNVVTTSSVVAKTGIGCGGAGSAPATVSAANPGGPGAAIIISW